MVFEANDRDNTHLKTWRKQSESTTQRQSEKDREQRERESKNKNAKNNNIKCSHRIPAVTIILITSKAISFELWIRWFHDFTMCSTWIPMWSTFIRTWRWQVGKCVHICYFVFALVFEFIFIPISIFFLSAFSPVYTEKNLLKSRFLPQN